MVPEGSKSYRWYNTDGSGRVQTLSVLHLDVAIFLLEELAAQGSVVDLDDEHIIVTALERLGLGRAPWRNASSRVRGISGIGRRTRHPRASTDGHMPRVAPLEGDPTPARTCEEDATSPDHCCKGAQRTRHKGAATETGKATVA
jgi:hypothetical protein